MKPYIVHGMRTFCTIPYFIFNHVTYLSMKMMETLSEEKGTISGIDPSS